MNNKRRISYLDCIVQSYKKRISSFRSIISILLIFGVSCAMMNGTEILIHNMNLKITPWMGPHFFSNKLYVTLFGFIICYMFSDVPFMNRSELYYILREGRLKWCIGKVGAIFLQSVTITMIALCLAVIVYMPDVAFEWGWGSVIYTMAYSFDLIVELQIYGEPNAHLLETYTPLQAIGLTLLVVSLITFLIGLLMFVLSIYVNRILAITVSVGMANLQLALLNIPPLMKLYYISPFTWMMIGTHGQQSFGNQYFPTLSYSLIMTGILVIVCMVLIMLRLRHLEFRWYKED